jgi:hypothetical protein
MNRAFNALLLVALFGSACTTLTNAPAEAPSQTQNGDMPEPAFITKIASIPLGQVVELNNEYLGLTPLELVLPGTGGGKWEGSALNHYVMRCSTPDNRTWEIKRWRGGERIPTRVLFRPPGAEQRMAIGQR